MGHNYTQSPYVAAGQWLHTPKVSQFGLSAKSENALERPFQLVVHFAELLPHFICRFYHLDSISYPKIARGGEHGTAYLPARSALSGGPDRAAAAGASARRDAYFDARPSGTGRTGESCRFQSLWREEQQEWDWERVACSWGGREERCVLRSTTPFIVDVRIAGIDSSR